MITKDYTGLIPGATVRVTVDIVAAGAPPVPEPVTQPVRTTQDRTMMLSYLLANISSAKTVDVKSKTIVEDLKKVTSTAMDNADHAFVMLGYKKG